MSSTKGLKAEASVKARLHQFESAVASAEHLSKHPEKLRRRQRGKGSVTSGNDSEEDSDSSSFEFADLIRALTGESTGGASEKEALHEAFKILDCDADGFITLSDLRESIKGFDSDSDDEETEMSDEDLVDMIAAADEKGNGRISFESFVKILEPSKSNPSDKSSKTGNKKSSKR